MNISLKSMSKFSEIDEYEGNALNSPFSRVYLCPETEQIMNCAMGLKYPIDVQAFKKAFSNSIMLKDPRFCSLMVINPDDTREHWKRTSVNIDDHFILHYPKTETRRLDDSHNDDNDNDVAVNAYLADIAVSTPLSKNKPLWEVHVLVGLNCVVLRVHHALGDGFSLMSMLSACFGKTKERKSVVINGDVNMKNQSCAKRKWKRGGLLSLVKIIWFTIVFALRLLKRLLWVKDKVCVVSGGDGVEFWPRKLVTAKFKIEDFKSIKSAIPDVTFNDVLLGVISCGLSKYVDVKSSEAPRQHHEVTAILMVNLRENSSLKDNNCIALMEADSSRGLSSWGNKTGLVLLPIDCYNGLHSLDHVRAMKATMDKKKSSYEANLTPWGLELLTSYIGPKVASWVCHRVLCNTTLLISNIMGPSEEIAIANNPVTYIRVNVSSQPHAITIHMVSYAKKAHLQVMVAKDIIHDPEFLVKCFHDSFVEMKNCLKINLV